MKSGGLNVIGIWRYTKFRILLMENGSKELFYISITVIFFSAYFILIFHLHYYRKYFLGMKTFISIGNEKIKSYINSRNKTQLVKM